MKKILIQQNYKCSLSGVDLFFHKKGRKNRSTGTISLDRIDSSKGYIKGNVQWVHKTINKIKLKLSNSEFKYWCKLVAENN